MINFSRLIWVGGKTSLSRNRSTQGRKIISELPKMREAFNPSKDLKIIPCIEGCASSSIAFSAGVWKSRGASGARIQLDARYDFMTKTEEQRRTAGMNREATFEQKRLEAGYKQAEKLGPSVEREYAALVSKDPNAASVLLAKRQQENIIATLQQGGMTPEEIAKFGTGEQFQYPAAQQALKTRGVSSQEKARAGQLFVSLDKQRRDAGFDPTLAEKGQDPYADTAGQWTPAHEQAYQTSVEYLNSLTPQLGGNRAGVAGMNTAPGFANLSEQALAARTATSLPARPVAGTAKPAATPGGTDPVGTTKVVNGVPSVKGKDGKWYKVKGTR